MYVLYATVFPSLSCTFRNMTISTSCKRSTEIKEWMNEWMNELTATNSNHDDAIKQNNRKY